MRVLAGVMVFVALTTSGGNLDPPTPIDYEVVAVHRKVFHVSDEDESRLETGMSLHSGDRVRTGTGAQLELEAAAYNTRFRIYSKAAIVLAYDQPGVLLDVEQGRVRAVFGPLGERPADRIVTTPSAVLAVRGTEYGVEVDRKGNTEVVVFDGEVEVTDRGRTAPPVIVRPGQFCRIGVGQPPGQPRRNNLTSEDWERGQDPGRQSTERSPAGQGQHPESAGSQPAGSGSASGKGKGRG